MGRFLHLETARIGLWSEDPWAVVPITIGVANEGPSCVRSVQVSLGGVFCYSFFFSDSDQQKFVADPKTPIFSICCFYGNRLMKSVQNQYEYTIGQLVGIEIICHFLDSKLYILIYFSPYVIVTIIRFYL